MKNFLFLLLAALPLQLHGQEPDSLLKFGPHRHTTLYKSNIIPMLWGSIPLTSEYRIVREDVLSPFQSLQISVAYLSKGPFVRLVNGFSGPAGNLQIKGFRFQAGYKFFIKMPFGNSRKGPVAPAGFYAGPNISYSAALFTYTYPFLPDEVLSVSQTNVTIMMGYQFPVSARFYTDVFFGLGVKRNVWHQVFSNGTQIPFDPGFGGVYEIPVKIQLGANFGFGFPGKKKAARKTDDL